MKRLFKLTVAIVSLYMALNGCAVDELKPPAPFSAAAAVISTSMESAQAFASVLQARDLLIATTDLYKDLGEISLNIMATDPTLANKGTDIACADGGTYKYDGTTTGGTYNLTLTFSGCRENRFQFEGSYAVANGTPASITVTLGGTGSLNIFYFNSAYTVLIDYLKAQSSFTMSGSGTATDASYTIKPSGKITNFDYFLLDTYTVNYSGLSTSYALSTNPVTKDQTISITADGSLGQTSVIRGLTITLAGFRIDRTKHWNAGTSSFTADDTSLSGAAAFNYRPNNYCFEGQYAIATTTPAHTDYVLGHSTQGTLTLNGIAMSQYNAGGDIDASVTGATPLNYADEIALMKVCDYSAMEENTPPLLGPTGTAVGSTMAVTLTWVDKTGSTSDQDLHVKYYDTVTPTGATPEKWHIDWHQGKSCADPSGLAFGDGLDTNGDGTCDVGLDFDDTNGYGPEHITALRLPVGYYVVSVDSYGNGNPPATLYLAVHIGNFIYGPFTGTLDSSDGEGTSPAAWFRVADVRVNADGTVDVLAPNASLTPWH